MKQLLQNYKTSELQLAGVPSPALKSGGVLVKNNFTYEIRERKILKIIQESLNK